MLVSAICYILIALILIRTIVYYKRLIIKTQKTWIENSITVLGMAVIAGLAVCFAKTIFHGLFCIPGMLMMFLFVYCEGISEDGIIILSRGNVFFSWSKIRNITISRKKYLVVRYFSQTGSEITKHRYLLSDEERLAAFFREKNIVMEIL